MSKDINKSIDLNIIGTCNLVKEASKSRNIKFIYLSTSYVYPGNKGNYSEEDCFKTLEQLFLVQAWRRMCAVQMYKNSLIVRLCMTEKPFVHNKAYANVRVKFYLIKKMRQE